MGGCLRPYDLGRVSKIGQDFPSLEGLGMLFLHTSSIVMPGFDASLSLNMVMINGVHGCMGHMMGMHLAIRYLAVSEKFCILQNCNCNGNPCSEGCEGSNVELPAFLVWMWSLDRQSLSTL